jgi:lipoyl(octanoyl) transferase
VADTRQGAPGVYVGDAKIAALGLRIKNGRSYHGLSLNVDIDLAPFSWINPCGYAGLQTTQMRDLLDEAPADLLPRVQQDLQRALAESLL